MLFITTAGTFIPCCSIDDCCADQLADTASHNEHKDEGTCSPFFACATCPVSVELAKSIQLDFQATENLVHYEDTITFILPSYSSSFWQPPRSC